MEQECRQPTALFDNGRGFPSVRACVLGLKGVIACSLALRFSSKNEACDVQGEGGGGRVAFTVLLLSAVGFDLLTGLAFVRADYLLFLCTTSLSTVYTFFFTPLSRNYPQHDKTWPSRFGLSGSLDKQSAWFLISKDHDTMTMWMTAINAQIYQLFTKSFTPLEDNYWSQG